MSQADKKPCPKTAANYLDYKKLRSAGHSHDSALDEMGYLHPISLAKLRKFIKTFEEN